MLGVGDISALQRLRYNGHWFLEHLYGETLLAKGAPRALFESQKRALRERIRRTMARKGAGRIFEVDERNDLSPEVFVREYLSQARPVVMRGAASSWECCKTWTPGYFAERYGDDRALIIHLEKDWNEDHSTEETNLREVIGSMGTGVMRYARFVPLLKNHPELFDHFDRGFIERYVGHEIKLWGRPGGGVPFHWHHVSNPTDSIGIGIRWYWKVSARKSCWTQNRLSFMAKNPTMQEFLQNGDDFAYNFGKTRPVGIDND
jgi:hypothetical protein